MQGRKGGCGSEGGTLLRKDVEADGLLLAAAGKAALVRDIHAVCWWLGCTQEAQAGRSCWGPPCWGGPSTYSLASTVTKQQICLRLCFLALSPHGTTAGCAMQAWTLRWCSLDSGRGFFFFFLAFVASPSQPTPPVMAASCCSSRVVGQGPLPGLGGLGAWGNCLRSHYLLLIIWFWLCFHPFPLQNTSGAALIPLVVSLPQVARRGTRAGWWPGKAWQACWWPLWRLQKRSCIL